MKTLKRLIATALVDEMQEREHVLVTHCQRDSLRAEFETIIAPSLDRLPSDPAVAQPCASAQHTAPESTVDARAQQAAACVAAQIPEQLHGSDHVEDIYADDDAIQRAAYRSVRDTLLRYLRGELAHGSPTSQSAATHHCDIDLLQLGYVSKMVSRRLDAAGLSATLERAAAAAQATLTRLWPEPRRALFVLDEAAGASRLGLEEAIVAELLSLVHDGDVAIPSIEQLVELTGGGCNVPGFERALAEACAATRYTSGCAAQCEVLSPSTFVARLTPLSYAGAENAEQHFANLLAAVERTLERLDSAPPAARRSRSHSETNVRGPGRSMAKPSDPANDIAAQQIPEAPNSGTRPQRNALPQPRRRKPPRRNAKTQP